MQTPTNLVNATSVTMSSYELVHIDLDGLISLVSSISSGYYTFPASSSERRDVMETYHITLRVPRSLSS